MAAEEFLQVDYGICRAHCSPPPPPPAWVANPRGRWHLVLCERGFARAKGMNAQTEMLGELRGRRAGHTLPRNFYTDPAYYQLDLETIWYREWLFVGP